MAIPFAFMLFVLGVLCVLTGAVGMGVFTIMAGMAIFGYKLTGAWHRRRRK